MAKIQMLGIGIGGVAFCALMYAGTGTASADTILVGGHDDGDCHMYHDVGINGDCAVYSAQIAPLEGQQFSMNVSTNEAADVAQQMMNDNPGRYDTCRGWSEGTAGCLKLAQREPVHVVLDGDPYGSTGMFRNPVPIAAVVSVADVPVNLPVPPGSERNFHQLDGIGNGGPQNVAGLITQASTPYHIIPVGEPDVTFTDREGVVNNQWNDPPQWMPINSGKDFGPGGVPLPPEAPAGPVLADPQDAFGQQMAGLPPCVAPDGGTYFTAAGLGC